MTQVAEPRPETPQAVLRRFRLAGALGLVLWGAAAPRPAQEARPAARSGPARAYHHPLDSEALLSAWLGSGMAERLDLGVSAGGRPLFAVQLGAPGPTPLAERTTVLLVGGLDGVSLAGSEAVLATVERLLSVAGALPPSVTFVAVPWANPDALVRTYEQGAVSGRNDEREDEDRDGAFDEDGPDDLDGDGVLLELLLEDPDGPWVRCTDPRFLRPARPGDAPRYFRLPEGADDDGDGRFNEDGPGGVVLDRNFPYGWSGPWTGLAGGPWPLSEPEARALAELALARRTALFVLFQGNHGRLLGPGGTRDAGPELPLPGDRAVYDRLAAELTACGRGDGTWIPMRELTGEDRPGSPVDWAYTALGALAFELAPWGALVDGRTSEPEIAVTREGAVPPAPPRSAPDDRTPADREWARWLDDTRGGIGFVDWQPVELEHGRTGLVGGWERWTYWNPPEDVLSRAVGGLPELCLRLAADLPRLEVELLEGVRQGRLCRLGVRVHNRGALPSGMGPAGTGGLVVRLQLGEGMQLVAGEPVHELPHLPGGGATEVLEWLVLAPEGALFGIEIESPWCPPDLREIRL